MGKQPVLKLQPYLSSLPIAEGKGTLWPSTKPTNQPATAHLFVLTPPIGIDSFCFLDGLIAWKLSALKEMRPTATGPNHNRDGFFFSFLFCAYVEIFNEAKIADAECPTNTIKESSTRSELLSSKKTLKIICELNCRLPPIPSISLLSSRMNLDAPTTQGFFWC